MGGWWTSGDVFRFKVQDKREKVAKSLVPFDHLTFQNRLKGGDGTFFYPGDRIILVRKTEDDPHHQKGEKSHGWYARAKNGTTVWYSIEDMVLRGDLVLEPSTSAERAAREVLCT